MSVLFHAAALAVLALAFYLRYCLHPNQVWSTDGDVSYASCHRLSKEAA